MRLTSRACVACGLAVLASTAGAQSPAGAPSAGARIDRASFACQRRIPEGVPGVASLRLDLSALSHSRLADIRLVSADGFQVPYLLEADPVPLRVVLPPLVVVGRDDLPRSASPKIGHPVTMYALALPLAPLPPCSLVLETPARVFEREVRVLARLDKPRGRDAWLWQTGAWWRHADPDTQAAPLVLHLPSLDSTDARLVVDEGDNQPLPLERPALELRTWRLRFVREKGDALWLAYGRRDLGAPRYDLALLDGSLRDQAANEVAAEPEPAPGRPGAGADATLLFWSALVAAILVMLAVLARLLRTPPDQPQP